MGIIWQARSQDPSFEAQPCGGAEQSLLPEPLVMARQLRDRVNKQQIFDASNGHVIRSLFTDHTSKSVVPLLKSVQRPNCPTTVQPPPVVEDYTSRHIQCVTSGYIP